MGWPERGSDWDDALMERARFLFAETAERFGLQYEWEQSLPVEVACRYPAQKGLDFELWLSLSGDEFVCSGQQWYASIFPADDEYKWFLISKLIEGLITGEARLALYRALGWSRPYWTEAQLLIDGRWRSVSTGVGCAIPPLVQPTILRNGYPTRTGIFRPAVGSTLILLGVIGMVFWVCR